MSPLTRTLVALLTLITTALCNPTPISTQSLGPRDVPPSKSECKVPQAGPSLQPDVKSANQIVGRLDSQGDAPNFDNCCTEDNGGSKYIAYDDKFLHSVYLHGPDLNLKTGASSTGKKLYVGCARAANYLAGLIAGCNQGGIIDGGQNIVEAPGLRISV